jgi:hypothetical protein
LLKALYSVALEGARQALVMWKALKQTGEGRADVSEAHDIKENHLKLAADVNASREGIVTTVVHIVIYSSQIASPRQTVPSIKTAA